MNKFFKTAWIIFCIPLISFYLLASISTFVSPRLFSYISLFALAFPYLLGVFILCLVINFFIKKRLAYVMLILLPVGYFNIVNTFAFGRKVEWQTQKDSSVLRVMTWNVQGFSNYLRKKKSVATYRTNRDEMLERIHYYNPDIICIQEYRNIENAKRRISIRKQLDSMGYKYHFCSNDRVGNYFKNPAVRIEEGVALYSRLPLLDSSRINIDNGEKNENLIYGDILFNNKPVRIFTAHLQSFAIYEDTVKESEDGENIYSMTFSRRKVAAYKIRETEIKHNEEIATIRDAISVSPYPVIYCGDLNMTPASYNYRVLKGDNLQDAFLERGYGIGNTFYKLGPTLRIDVCLTDKALHVQQCKREKKKLSDHFPVIADVAWK